MEDFCQHDAQSSLRLGLVAWSDACPSGIQEVVGSIFRSGNILLWRFVM